MSDLQEPATVKASSASSLCKTGEALNDISRNAPLALDAALIHAEHRLGGSPVEFASLIVDSE